MKFDNNLFPISCDKSTMTMNAFFARPEKESTGTNLSSKDQYLQSLLPKNTHTHTQKKQTKIPTHQAAHQAARILIFKTTDKTVILSSWLLGFLGCLVDLNNTLCFQGGDRASQNRSPIRALECGS